MRRELIDRHRMRVALGLVARHGVVDWSPVNVAWSAAEHRSVSLNALLIPWAVMGSLVYPASQTRAQPGPYGLRKTLDRASVEAIHPGGCSDTFGEGRSQVERLEEVAFDVVLVRRVLGVRPAKDHQGEAVVGPKPGPPTVGPDGDLEAVHRQIGEVAVVPRLQDRPCRISPKLQY